MRRGSILEECAEYHTEYMKFSKNLILKLSKLSYKASKQAMVHVDVLTCTATHASVHVFSTHVHMNACMHTL